MIAAANFRLHLHSAKTTFETLARHISTRDYHAVPALVDSVLFSCARANRIARDAQDEIRQAGVNVDDFLAFMKTINIVRNVTEHWTDVEDPRPLKLHTHVSSDGLIGRVDETALHVRGPKEILKGPINVYDVYLYVCRTLTEIKS